MSEEILVNVTPMETRVAVVENGATQDIYIERSASRGVVGNIYAGKVHRVLPGMQAAFVDIGLERNSFIHVSDIVGGDAANGELIRDHLHEGKKVIVQVTKDPLGTKGARLTTQLSVSSRYLVYMPDGDHIGVSQRIDDPEERERLQAMLEAGISAAAELSTTDTSVPDIPQARCAAWGGHIRLIGCLGPEGDGFHNSGKAERSNVAQIGFDEHIGLAQGGDLCLGVLLGHDGGELLRDR